MIIIITKKKKTESLGHLKKILEEIINLFKYEPTTKESLILTFTKKKNISVLWNGS